MLKIEKVESLAGRILRCDEPIEELGRSSYDVLRDMIRGGKTDEALKLLDYVQHEFKWLHDIYTDWTYADLDYIAKTYGEEELPKFLRYAKSKLDLVAYKGYGKITQLDLIRYFAEGMRAHRCGPGETGSFVLREEKDRYVMEFDPCGSGGRMRRTGELDDLPPRTGEPFHYGVTSKPYAWSWNKKGVPYYCLHCCVWHEQMAIEKSGAPIKITDYQDDPEAPCRWLFYKPPEDIPEEYYVRIGMKKPENYTKANI
jgi:hypothetical protein